MPAHRHKTANTEVRQGTKKYAVLQRLLAPEGVTRLNSGVSSANFHSSLDSLNFDSGYDIRVIATAPNPRTNFNVPIKTYRIVGRFGWNGGYEDYIANGK